MKYFNYLSTEEKQSIFYSLPKYFDYKSEKKLISYALGALLYMPVTKNKITQSLIQKKFKGLISMVLDLEDAIGDLEVGYGEQKLVDHLKEIDSYIKNEELKKEELPFIFVRVRSVSQMARIKDLLGELLFYITGFIFPKFCEKNIKYFEILREINRVSRRPIYGMPILETKDVLYKETRMKSLESLNGVFTSFRDLILNIRIGATDFCSLYGIRRSYDLTIYDIAVIRDCICDIINYFSRFENEYVVSAPVWEYFSKADRVLKPQLREGLFEDDHGMKVRERIIDKYIDGLIKEVLLDKANGLNGKTIIHPTHILPVQALYVVSHEEYMDACSILECNTGERGVIKSKYENKMNEIKPHITWAKKILIRADIYGVFHENKNFTSILAKNT